MTLDEVMKELAGKARESQKRTLLRHGAKEPLFGVRIGDLTPLRKRLKGRQDLALELYATGNSDAMYLAGLIADGSKMSAKELDRWANDATWHMIAGCSVPWVAAEHPEAWEIASKWTESRKELVATAGWSTWASLVCVRPDAELPLADVEAALARVVRTIHAAPNRVRYAMNSFVICCGTYVAPLAARAIETSRSMGRVEVDMGDTDCRVPDAESYILRSRRGASVAPKRKTTRC